MRLGLSDPRVAPLRQRLRIGGYRIDADAATPELFDLELQHAVERFQREHRLNADGAVGKITQAELDLPVSARIDQMRVNLERARWLLHETSREFLLIDIAGFRAIHFEDGVQTWRTRIQVGQAFRQTPEYRSRITHVDFNPSWTVPPTIFRKDMLPRIRRDPDYLTRQKLRVLDADSGEQLDPAGVDWNDPRGILLRQDPGPGNALGRIAIRFPNPYAIYLHDTPHCALFSRDERALSSGCIRVENPIDLVERLLADPERWSRQRIETIIADGRGIRAQLPRTVTILLAYWTVEVHDDDRVSFRRDVYGRDAAVLAALNRRLLSGLRRRRPEPRRAWRVGHEARTWGGA